MKDWLARRRDALLLALVLVVGLAVTASLTATIRANEELQLRARLESETRRALATSRVVALQAVAAVQGASQMFAAQETVTRGEFSRLARRVLEDTPGLRALQWQPLVPRARREAFEQAAQLEGYPGYRFVEPDGRGGLRPAGARDFYVPIHYYEPGDLSAPGLDLAFDADRLVTKLIARDMGEPVASTAYWPILAGGRQEPQEPGRLSFIVSAPVYRLGGGDTVAQRRELIAGWVGGIVRVASLFHESAIWTHFAGLDLLVFDASAKPRQLVYARVGEGSDLASPGGDYAAGEYDTLTAMLVGGRTWEVVLHPRPAFFASVSADARSTAFFAY